MLTQEELDQVIEDNPMVDGDLLAEVMSEDVDFNLGGNEMVNFNMDVPYSTDTIPVGTVAWAK